MKHWTVSPLLLLLFAILSESFVKLDKQAGAELGQAQLNLGLDFTLIFCRTDFTGYSLE